SEKGPSCGLIEDRCTSGLRIPFSVTGRAAICATRSSEPEAEESAETTICVAPCRAGGRIPWIEMVLPVVLAWREAANRPDGLGIGSFRRSRRRAVRLEVDAIGDA